MHIHGHRPILLVLLGVSMCRQSHRADSQWFDASGSHVQGQVGCPSFTTANDTWKYLLLKGLQQSQAPQRWSTCTDLQKGEHPPTSSHLCSRGEEGHLWKCSHSGSQKTSKTRGRSDRFTSQCNKHIGTHTHEHALAVLALQEEVGNAE